MKNICQYRAKDIITKQWVYGDYVGNVNGCVPLIITNAWMEDDGEVYFDYHFIDDSTVEIVEINLVEE